MKSKYKVLCGPSMEPRIRISSVEVQKTTGLQLLEAGSRQEKTGLVPGKFTEQVGHILKLDLSFPTIFELRTMNTVSEEFCVLLARHYSEKNNHLLNTYFSLPLC